MKTKLFILNLFIFIPFLSSNSFAETLSHNTDPSGSGILMEFLVSGGMQAPGLNYSYKIRLLENGTVIELENRNSDETRHLILTLIPDQTHLIKTAINEIKNFELVADNNAPTCSDAPVTSIRVYSPSTASQTNTDFPVISQNVNCKDYQVQDPNGKNVVESVKSLVQLVKSLRQISTGLVTK